MTDSGWLEQNVMINCRMPLPTVKFIAQLFLHFYWGKRKSLSRFSSFSGREMLLIVIQLIGTF